MKTITLILISLIGVAPFYLASSEIQSRLLKCSEVESQQARLQCYDKLTSSIQIQQDKSDSSRAVPVNNNSSEELVAQKHLTEASEPTANQAKIEEQSPLLEQGFGKPEKEKPIEAIHSSILGKFKGWRKGIRLKLANGQIWKVVSSTKSYTNLDSPNITISKALLGSFTAKIEGVTAMAKVKRIK